MWIPHQQTGNTVSQKTDTNNYRCEPLGDGTVGAPYLTTANIKDSMLVTPRCSQGWSVFISRIFFMMKMTFSMN